MCDTVCVCVCVCVCMCMCVCVWTGYVSVNILVSIVITKFL